MSGVREQTESSEKLTLDDGHDGALLDSRGALETVGVDTTEKLGLQVHRIEGVGGLIVVRLDLSCSAKVQSAQFVSRRIRRWLSTAQAQWSHWQDAQ